MPGPRPASRAPRLILVAVVGALFGGALAIPFSGRDDAKQASPTSTVIITTDVDVPSSLPTLPATDPIDSTESSTTTTVSSLGTAPPATLVAAPANAAPDVDARAFVVFDVASGSRMAERESATPMPVGSLMKLLTAYVVLQGGALEQRVTVPPIPFDPTVQMIGLVPGETFERATLFRAMLIYSAADAAHALALDRSGGEDAFAAEMNAAAQSLGMSSTVARNATGLDASGQQSNADDLLTLTRVLMTDATFRAAVSKTTATMHGKAYPNTNDLLVTYQGADGVKTGSTTQAGSCLVASATRDGRQIIVVVLGSSSDEARFQAAASLLDWAFANG